MFFIKFNIAVLLATTALASISVRKTGWLDRVVEYHKQNFYKDVQNNAPVQINVTLEPVPEGYWDSTLWTYDSVMHLLVLISQSESARPVRRALRRMMKPTRRYLSREKSFKLFPSIMKYYRNEFYYDIESSVEEYPDPTFGGVPDDDAVIMVSNPVEARLPSARISVRLLREILDARAQAARYMETTPPSTFSWKPMNKTAADGVTEAEGSGSGDDGSGDGSGDGSADGSGDAEGEAPGDAPGDEGGEDEVVEGGDVEGDQEPESESPPPR